MQQETRDYNTTDTTVATVRQIIISNIMAITCTTQDNMNAVPDCFPKVQSAKTKLSMSNHSRGSVATSHRTSSTGSMQTNSSDIIEIEPLNDLGGFLVASSEYTRDNSVTQCSIGESSLSSFLSILLEDELPYEIVSDNPKPEQQSIRDLRLSFMASALENDKPKCRWDYLTRDNSDRDFMRKRRNKMAIRSVSFSGAISSTKQWRSDNSNTTTTTNSSFTTTATTNNKQGGNSGNAASMLLRMPQRQRSPTDDEIAKKSLSNRMNMSDSDLMRLRMPNRRGSGEHSNNNNNNDNNNRNNSATGRERRRLSRSGVHETSTGNASWSKSDVSERRRENSNLFLDIMIETDGGPGAGIGVGVCAASPLTTSMSSLESSSSSALQMPQQQQEDFELPALPSTSNNKSNNNNKNNSCSPSSKRSPKMPRSPRSPRKTKSLPPVN